MHTNQIDVLLKVLAWVEMNFDVGIHCRQIVFFISSDMLTSVLTNDIYKQNHAFVKIQACAFVSRISETWQAFLDPPG